MQVSPPPPPRVFAFWLLGGILSQRDVVARALLAGAAGNAQVFEQLIGEEKSMSEISFTAAFCHQIALRKARCEAAKQLSSAEL